MTHRKFAGAIRIDAIVRMIRDQPDHAVRIGNVDVERFARVRAQHESTQVGDTTGIREHQATIEFQFARTDARDSLATVLDVEVVTRARRERRDVIAHTGNAGRARRGTAHIVDAQCQGDQLIRIETDRGFAAALHFRRGRR